MSRRFSCHAIHWMLGNRWQLHVLREQVQLLDDCHRSEQSIRSATSRNLEIRQSQKQDQSLYGLPEDTARHRSRRSERQLLCWTDVEETLAFFSSLHFSHFIMHRKKILFILIIYTSISQACIMIWDIKSHGSTRGEMNSLSCAVIWLLVLVVIICIILFTAGVPSSLQSSPFSLSLSLSSSLFAVTSAFLHTHTYIPRLKWTTSECLDVCVKTCYWLLLLLLVLITFFLTLLSVSS